MHTLRVIGRAAEMEASSRMCTACCRPLRGKIAWLEFDQRIDAYHDFGDVPDDKSQGWFPFGLTCARKAVARASRVLAKAPRND